MDACFGPKLRHKRNGNAGRSVIFTTTKTIIYPSFSPRIDFRSERYGFDRDWTWTFHCFSIGYLRAGVILLLQFAICNQRAHTRHTLSTLFWPSNLSENLFVTFATIPTPSQVRWHGVLLYLSFQGKSSLFMMGGLNGRSAICLYHISIPVSAWGAVRPLR